MTNSNPNTLYCSNLTIRDAVSIALGIDDYDPDFHIEELEAQVELAVKYDDPNQKIDDLRNHLLQQKDLYLKAENLSLRMQNELTEWKSNGRDTLLAIDRTVFHTDFDTQEVTSSLDFKRTTLTTTSLFEWFLSYGYNVKQWSDESLHIKPSENDEVPTPNKKPKNLQANTREGYLMLIALLAEKLYDASQNSQVESSWVKVNGKPKTCKIIDSVAHTGLPGLSVGNIGKHFQKGKEILFDNDYKSKL